MKLQLSMLCPDLLAPLATLFLPQNLRGDSKQLSHRHPQLGSDFLVRDLSGFFPPDV